MRILADIPWCRDHGDDCSRDLKVRPYLQQRSGADGDVEMWIPRQAALTTASGCSHTHCLRSIQKRNVEGDGENVGIEEGEVDGNEKAPWDQGMKK